MNPWKNQTDMIFSFEFIRKIEGSILFEQVQVCTQKYNMSFIIKVNISVHKMSICYSQRMIKNIPIEYQNMSVLPKLNARLSSDSVENASAFSPSFVPASARVCAPLPSWDVAVAANEVSAASCAALASGVVGTKTGREKCSSLEQQLASIFWKKS